jgi:hypothetical protein
MTQTRDPVTGQIFNDGGANIIPGALDESGNFIQSDTAASATIHEITGPTSTVAGYTGVSYSKLTMSLDNINATASDVIYVWVVVNAGDAVTAATLLATPGARTLVKADAYSVEIKSSSTITDWYYKSAVAAPTQAVVLTGVGQ